MGKLNNRPRKCLGIKYLIKYFSDTPRLLHLRVESAVLNKGQNGFMQKKADDQQSHSSRIGLPEGNI